MKKIIFILIVFIVSCEGFSQQDPQYSLYMFNPLGVNPAYTGSREVLSTVLVHRSQWIGIKGAPKTQAFAINTPLKNKKMGVGLQIVNDKIGPKTQQYLKVAYAYRLKLGRGKLAFGLSGGIINYNYNWGKIDYKEQDDAIPTFSPESFIIPTFDFGIYYNSRTFYMGMSFEDINEAKYNLISIDTINNDARKYSHFLGTIGKAFELSDDLVLKTTILLRNSNSFGNIDLSAGLLLKDKLFFGLSIRKHTLVLLTELNLTQKLRMGFAYDVDGSDLSRSSSGSIEIFVGYDVSLFNSKVVSPRYF